MLRLRSSIAMLNVDMDYSSGRCIFQIWRLDSKTTEV
jgi:hypothetical protein